jgi:ribonucleoside-diphosphate reductase alpha chain
MESILDVGAKAIMVQKFGGGVGFTLSEIRPKGWAVQSTHGKAMGPVGVLRWLHAGAKMVTQGGKREGAQMGILHCGHPDIEDFITCKQDDPQALSTFNISVAMTDAEMKSNGTLLPRMAELAWKNGDPGCFFIDRAEEANPTPHVGRLDGTNPCGEVPLLDNEACNLGSINLSHFVISGRVDWDGLEYTTRTAVKYLDTIIDHNWFPREEIAKAVRDTRKIGLGVMGWADMLGLLGIHYDSAEAVQLGTKVMEFIDSVAHDESNHLPGTYPSSQNSRERNATLTCIAPTGTIAIIAGCSSGIEPHFATEWIRITGDGHELSEKIPSLDGFTPHTSHQIDWPWHIKHQAAFQKHTDLAVSKTINMPNSASQEDVLNAYKMAWQEGCKGVTIYRDGSRGEQVLNQRKCAVCERGIIVMEEGCERCTSCAYSACSV